MAAEDRAAERARRASVLQLGTWRFTFFCPGCRCYHFLDDRWSVQQTSEGPTVRPSVVAHGHERCHMYLTRGRVRYLADCSHALAGKTVPLEEFERVEPAP